MALAVIGCVRLAVALDWEPRHLGGEQVYLVCHCKRRVHSLYLPHLRCRRCARLAYRSRYEYWSPALRRLMKLRRRWGPLPRKPPYVRKDYYNRWIAELTDLEAKVAAKLGATAVALEQRQRSVSHAESTRA